jgi:hypothetical protein
MRVGDLIEHDHPVCALASLHNVEVRQGGGSERDSLMHGTRREEGGDVVHLPDLGPEAPEVNALAGEVGFGIAGEEEAFGQAVRIGKRGQNRMKTI